MPVCKFCGRVGATVEFRVSPTRGSTGERLYLCKDKLRCKKTKGAK